MATQMGNENTNNVNENAHFQNVNPQNHKWRIERLRPKLSKTKPSSLGFLCNLEHQNPTNYEQNGHNFSALASRIWHSVQLSNQWLP